MGFKNSKNIKSTKNSKKGSVADVFIKLEDTSNGMSIGTHGVNISDINYKGLTELKGKYDPPGTKAPVAEFVFENEDGETISKDIVLRDIKFSEFRRLVKAVFDEDRRKKLDDAYELLGKGFKMRVRQVEKIYMQPKFYSRNEEVIDKITESDLFPKKVLYDLFIGEFRDYGTGKFLSGEEIEEAERNFELTPYRGTPDIAEEARANIRLIAVPAVFRKNIVITRNFARNILTTMSLMSFTRDYFLKTQLKNSLKC